MNAVLDVLKLRRVKLDYISPPICPGLAIASGSGSGSGSFSFLEENDGATSPTIRIGGQCNAFVMWTQPPDALLFTLYKSIVPGDPESPYTLLADGVSLYTVRVCSPGWWYITTLDSEGNPGAPTDTVQSDGSAPVTLLIPRNEGDTGFRLFKNPDATDPTRAYTPVLESTTFGAVELCEPLGCYRGVSITDDGFSPLSNTVCRDEEENCCVEQVCPPGYKWDRYQCSCVEGVGGCTATLDRSTPAGQTDIAYSHTLVPNGGSPPFRFAIIGGTLPQGWVLSREGVIHGTTHFKYAGTVTVEFVDSHGTLCNFPVDINVVGCPPTVGTLSIPPWTADDPVQWINGEYDAINRRFWFINGSHYNTLPSYDIAIIDLITGTYIRNATDSAGVISAVNHGNFGAKSFVMDTKYGQAVIMGLDGFISFWDLGTMGTVSGIQSPYSDHTWSSYEAAYDENRGYIYQGTTLLGQLAINRFDCNPDNHGFITRFVGGVGKNGGEIVYCGLTDLCYITNPNGGTGYTIWDPNTESFSYNQGPAIPGNQRSVRYFPGLGMLMFATQGNGLWFVFPATGAVAMHLDAPSSGDSRFGRTAEDTCLGQGRILYAGNGLFASTGVHIINPQDGWSDTKVSGTTFFDQIYNLCYDPEGGRGFGWSRNANGGAGGGYYFSVANG
jgi:hypothetical protein